jgi:4-hydroxy-3-methylbut-2-en-1-yl diphosphate synthase IspG/GcpE
VVEGFNGWVKSCAAYSRLTWQGLGNASIHVSLVLMVVYAVCIAAYGLGRPELRQSIAFFA